MPDSLLPYKFEEAKKTSALIGVAGLPVYMDFMYGLDFAKALRHELDTKVSAGRLWKPSSIVFFLILLNLAGGDCVDDIQRLQEDVGLSKLLKKFQELGLSGSELCALRQVMSRQSAESVPSASTIFRFLKQDGQEGLEERGQGKAYIPVPGPTAKLLNACNKMLVSAVAANREFNSITLDMDATLIETHKSDALYSYKKFKAYQPQNVWWAEQRVMLYTEFRDGNVPAQYGMLPVLEQTLATLPHSDKPIYLRSDSAAYQTCVMRFCEDKNIGFAIGADVSPALRQSVHELPDSAWKRLDDKRQYAEVCFVPNSVACLNKDKYNFRYIATREFMQEQGSLFDIIEQKEHPFPVIDLKGKKYKLHAIVTNRDIAAPDLIKWYYKRSGNSEEAHAILKNELAGGTMPSNDFHANAIWWWISVISHNIHSAFKLLCCEESLQTSQLKHLRFLFITIPGMVIEHARCLIVRLNAGGMAYKVLSKIRENIRLLRPCPG